jgi:hypothetical protein
VALDFPEHPVVVAYYTLFATPFYIVTHSKSYAATHTKSFTPG